MAVKTEKELGQALKNGAGTIENEGDMVRKVIKIKATGKVAWAAAIGAIAVAIVAILAAPAAGGASTSASLVAAPAAVGVLGGTTALPAITIAVAVGAESERRINSENTRSLKISDNRILLKK